MKLLVVALDSEIENLNPEIPVLITGIGKVNATLALTKYLSRHPEIDFVINFGTAGSSKIKVGDLVQVFNFIQLDIDCRLLGYKQYETPNEDEIVLSFESPKNQKSWTIGTSDQFQIESADETNKSESEIEIDLFDMEAYALAKVCKEFDINFVCYKYVSDDCSQASGPEDWERNKTKGVDKFRVVLEKYQ